MQLSSFLVSQRLQASLIWIWSSIAKPMVADVCYAVGRMCLHLDHCDWGPLVLSVDYVAE
jgi:hypothetical protein